MKAVWKDTEGRGRFSLEIGGAIILSEFQGAEVVELVDALDSKSSGLRAVWVRVPPSAP